MKCEGFIAVGLVWPSGRSLSRPQDTRPAILSDSDILARAPFPLKTR